MDWLKQDRTKSQLGQLLLKNKLISEDQLKRAIDIQRSSGQLLGDIFTQLGVVSQRQVQGMLRKQRNIRRVATVVAALLAPIQVYAADTAPVPIEQSQESIAPKKQDSVRALNEDELSQVVGQGMLDDALRDWLNLSNPVSTNTFSVQNATNASLVNIAKQTAGLQLAGNLLTLMDPLLGLLGAQATVGDVLYNPAQSKSAINSDGSVTLSLPSSIGELSVQNIRVMGGNGPSLGTVEIKGIDLAGTTITVRPH